MRKLLSPLAALVLAAPALAQTLPSPAFKGFTVTGNSTKPITLDSQPGPIFGNVLLKGSTTSETGMEFFDAGDFNAATGSTISKLAIDNYKRAKVATYRAVYGGAAAGDMYASNYLCNSKLGHSGNCIASELDLNDANTSQNSAVSFTDLQAGNNLRSAIYISGSTVNPVSGGILMNMAANGFKAQRAVGVFNGTIAGDVYDDNVNAPAGNVIHSAGTKAGGINFTELTMTTAVALGMKQGHNLRWYSPDASQTSSITTDGSNVFQLGIGAASINLAASTKSTATPSIAQLYAGLTVNAGLVYDLTAAAGTAHPEQSGVFRMTNTGGAAGSSTSYKMALGAETTCGTSSSSMCWGMTTVLTANAGYSRSNNMISFESNMNNNSGTNCDDSDYGSTGAPCVVNLIAVGGANQISAAYGVTGSSLIRNGFVVYSGGALAADFRSYSQSQATIIDTGSHAVGAAWNGSYSLSPMQISSFGGSGNRSLCVDNSGYVYAHAAGSC